jgi:hypothetical protein
MNKEQQELLDEAYKNFENQCIPGHRTCHYAKWLL